MLPLFATTLDIDPLQLIRVEDPAHASADATSATGAVLLERPPPGVKWRYESVPHVDTWPATDGIEALNADHWHERGITGEGVKIAIFDVQWYGVEADPQILGEVTTHDCYAHRSCEVPLDTWRPRFTYEQGVHGYGCAQIVRDIAPGVELHLVRVNGDTSLENAVHWAIREGVDVISMSLSFFNRSFYDGTGRVNELMDELVAAGVLMVASVGNYAGSHWGGAYVDADLDGRMDFEGDDGLWVYLGAGPAKTVYVAWNQYRSCGTSDFDVYAFDEAGNVVGRSEDVQDLVRDPDHCEPMERLSLYAEEQGWYKIEVVHRRGATSYVEFNVLATSGTVHEAIPEGSMTDPSSHPRVFAVGAVRADGYLYNDIESFSSRGPTPDGRPKPDIAGPDGLTTYAYGAQGFYGTSASTPAVAAAIALVMSEDPRLTPYEAAERLQYWALTDDAVFESPDSRFGAGKARLPVLDEDPPACGERPLLLPILVLPFAWFHRRARRRLQSRRG